MTTLYASTRPVKSARPFGLGLLASSPVVRVDYSAADAAWWAAESAAAEDRRLDALAEEARQMDRIQAGYTDC